MTELEEFQQWWNDNSYEDQDSAQAAWMACAASKDTSPNWIYAPNWANYTAQDEDGGWYWYENIPTLDNCVWAGVGRYTNVATVLTPNPDNFTTTLQPRPNKE